MPPPFSFPVGAEAPRAAEPTAPDRNVAVGSHGEYGPTVTNFSLFKPLHSRPRFDDCTRQTDVGLHHRLMPPPI